MIKAYLILAHKNPAQLERLIRTLDDGRSFFFIHIDKATDITLFKGVANQNDQVRFVRRERAEWARYGLVQATLYGLEAVRNAKIDFKHVILLSGQDYPIKSNEFINRFTEENAEKIFIEYHRLPDYEKWQPNGGLYRVDKYFLGFNYWQKFCSKTLNFLSGRFSSLQRRMYNGMEPYAGSMWWTLNMTAIHYILDFIQDHPGYVAFHQHTFAVDEVFFHTILLNAKDSRISKNIVNENSRFIKWKDHASSHPEIIGASVLHELKQSKALFARKFEPEEGSDILDLIDSQILSTSQHEKVF